MTLPIYIVTNFIKKILAIFYYWHGILKIFAMIIVVIIIFLIYKKIMLLLIINHIFLFIITGI